MGASFRLEFSSLQKYFIILLLLIYYTGAGFRLLLCCVNFLLRVLIRFLRIVAGLQNDGEYSRGQKTVR